MQKSGKQENTPDQNLPEEHVPDEYQVEQPHQFIPWAIEIASGLSYGTTGRLSYDDALEILVGHSGRLVSDDEGYPIFCNHPFDTVEQGTELITILYKAAFLPYEQREKDAGRDHTYLRVYSGLWDPEKGVGDCVGILEDREPFSNTAPPEESHKAQYTRLRPPDKLLFHDNYVNIKGFSCSSEDCLYDLYTSITERKVTDPVLEATEGLSTKALRVARQANNAGSEKELAVILLGLAADAVSENLTRAEESMYYMVIDALQNTDEL